MSARAGLVLDANIVIRAVFGMRVRGLLRLYSGQIDYLTPDASFEEATRYVGTLANQRGMDAVKALGILRDVAGLIEIVPESVYLPYRSPAMERIGWRDPKDWPVVALCLSQSCSLWTEDRDFFGTGLATWTTRHIEIYLKEQAA